LQALARLHQRRLASSEEEGRAQLPCQIPALPADLLWLPEQLAAMQAQLVTLQQQVTDLTRLLQQHRPEPAIPLAPTKPTSTAKSPAKPTRSRPAATAFPKGAWRAHRQIRNHSYTLRLAPNQELTMAVLEQAAEALQAHLT